MATIIKTPIILMLADDGNEGVEEDSSDDEESEQDNPELDEEKSLDY